MSARTRRQVEVDDQHSLLQSQRIQNNNRAGGTDSQSQSPANIKMESQGLFQGSMSSQTVETESAQPEEEQFGNWELAKSILGTVGTDFIVLYAAEVVLVFITIYFKTLIPWHIGKLIELAGKGQSQLNAEISHFIHRILRYSLLKLACEYTGRYLTELLTTRLRAHSFKSLLCADYSFLQKLRVGELGTRLVNDIEAAKNCLTEEVFGVLLEGVSLLANLWMILYINPWAGACFLLLVPALTWIGSYYSSKISIISRKLSLRLAEQGGHLRERIAAAEFIKMASKQKFEVAQYQRLLQDSFETSRELSWVRLAQSVVTNGLPCAVLLGSVFYFYRQITGGRMSIAQLSSFLVYANGFKNSTEELSDNLASLSNAHGTVWSLFELMSRRPAIYSEEGLEFKPRQVQIKFSRVQFSYPGSRKVALDLDNFVVAPGTYVAFVGESGSGKSTVLKLLTRSYDLKFGSISLNDINVKEIQWKDLHRTIALVRQEPQLLPGTLRQNICYGCDNYTEQDVLTACEKTGLLQFIRQQKQGLDTVIQEGGTNLSVGQKQRICIARAIVRRPKILVLDQATSSLDRQNQKIVVDTIEWLRRSSEISIVAVAHRLEVTCGCDQLLVMRQGRVVERGSHSELLQRKQSYYSELWRNYNKQIFSA